MDVELLAFIWEVEHPLEWVIRSL
ncbi:Protein of unknown function [Bacillus cytotoxicus]|uniref:Uncharacterized protein n=1 Tax=Bacillus cytotoxicus TaxID=580165 RepID=A0AAX2CN88_9BACI|nr:Protein of unknown function [Bacillus cytotoxicus]